MSVINIAKVTASDDKRHLANFAPESGSNIKSETAYVTGNADEGNSKVNNGNFNRYGGLVKGILLDVKGGMSVKGWIHEVTAYLVRDGETINIYVDMPAQTMITLYYNYSTNIFSYSNFVYITDIPSLRMLCRCNPCELQRQQKRLGRLRTINMWMPSLKNYSDMLYVRKRYSSFFQVEEDFS